MTTLLHNGFKASIEYSINVLLFSFITDLSVCILRLQPPASTIPVIDLVFINIIKHPEGMFHSFEYFVRILLDSIGISG